MVLQMSCISKNAQEIQPMDPVALGMAGGTTAFASLNDIKVLRRESGQLKSIQFRYGDVEKGKNLQQNIILKSGDTVLVP